MTSPLNRFLIRKCWSEARWPLAACAVAVFSYAWLRVWFVSELQMDRFQSIVLQLWDEIGKFSSVPLAELFTYRGRVARTFTEPIVTMCLTAWAVSRGSDCVSGELGRGTLEIVLTQPVTRLQVLWTQAAVTTLGAAALCFAIWAGMLCGVATNTVETQRRPELAWGAWSVPIPFTQARIERQPLGEHFELASQLPGFVSLFCLTFCLAGAATLLSAMDQYRWRTIGLMIAFLVVESTLQYVALAKPQFHWLGWLTIFSFYTPELAISLGANEPEELWRWVRVGVKGRTELAPLGSWVALTALGAASYLAAAQVFKHRDLAPPP